MKIVNVKQRTPEWHEWRGETGAIYASDVAVLLNQSPYKTPWRLWMERTGKAESPDISNLPHVRRGIENEAIARQFAEGRLDIDFLLPICAESDEYPFIRCSFDGISDEGVPVELKCPTQKTFDSVLEKGINADAVQLYLPQLHLQMFVADSDEGYLCFLSPDCEDFVMFPVQRNETLMAEIIEAAKAFNTLLLNDVPPERDPERDLFVPLGDDMQTWNKLATRFIEVHAKVSALSDEIKPLEDELDTLKQGLTELMGDFEEAELGGVRVKVSNVAGAVDWKKLAESISIEITPEMQSKFRRKSSRRVKATLTDDVMPKGIKQLVVSGTDSKR